MRMTKFQIGNNAEYVAEDFLEGCLINPLFLDEKLPEIPFIIRMEHSFSVHCSINGWLRCWGVFDNLDDALACAKSYMGSEVQRYENVR
jgi:hypothetical protein